jgi:Ca2+:H+ antiporter
MPAPSNGSLSDEHTPLIGRTQNHENESRFSTIPKHVIHLTYATLTSNYVNVLLVFVPLGIIAGIMGWNPTAVFVLNFIAIIPLAALLSFATEELSAKLGQTLGGLMNATFGNAVELIVSIVALKQGEIRIVQSSMLGSILSNILLVLGCCFLAGGIRHRESRFNETVASTMSSLMAVASASLIIPATLYAVMSNGNTNHHDTDANILVLSHGTSIILLLLYILYLYFQLYSHHDLFADVENQGGEEDEATILSPVAAGVALVVVTVMVAICAEFLVDSIDSIVETAHISKTFVGLILIPIVGNAAEHVTAVIVAYKGKMDLAINVAIGSSMQIALFVTPFLVILGWIMHQPMTLHFEGFETIIFFISVLIVNYLIQDGKSNYLEGAMCIGIYAIIALAFYIYPDSATGDLGPKFIQTFFGRS